MQKYRNLQRFRLGIFYYFYPFNAANMSDESTTQLPRKRHRGEAIWAIIWNLVFLWIINKVPDWDLIFINDRYEMVMWVLTLNILLQIAGYAIVFFLDFRWVWYLVRSVIDAASLVVLLVLYFLNPFDFSGVSGWEWLDIVLPIVFIVGMVIAGIGMVVNLIKLIFRSEK